MGAAAQSIRAPAAAARVRDAPRRVTPRHPALRRLRGRHTRPGTRSFEYLDANRDGHVDSVVYLDKETLVRNGDLRVGRNRLVMTGALRQPPTRVPGTLVARPLSVPARGVVEFDVLP